MRWWSQDITDCVNTILTILARQSIFSLDIKSQNQMKAWMYILVNIKKCVSENVYFVVKTLYIYYLLLWLFCSDSPFTHTKKKIYKEKSWKHKDHSVSQREKKRFVFVYSVSVLNLTFNKIQNVHAHFTWKSYNQ